MYEDLEPIANLKFWQAVPPIVKEMQQRVAEFSRKYPVQGSGRIESAKVDMRLDAIERECRTLYDIWVELITRRNGKLTRDDIDFIMAKVELCAGKFGVTRPPTPTDVLSSQFVADMGEQRRITVLSAMRTGLEIMIREQDAFPRKAEMPQNAIHLDIQNSNIANLNLGSQLGTIQAILQNIANEHHEQLAEALKQLTEGIADSKTLNGSVKMEAIEAVSVLAKQAEAKPEERSSVTVKAVLNWIPTLIRMATDLTTLWDKVGPTIRAHFSI